MLLYEGAFNHDYDTRKGEERDILGMVGGGSMNHTMILSKPSLHEGFACHNSKQNVGIHEFVHLLDRADGTTDGIPEALLQQPFLIPWAQLMHREIKAIKSGTSEINFYGSTSKAEFLSVVSEYFFQQPQLLEKHHPQLFGLLEKVFRQVLKSLEHVLIPEVWRSRTINILPKVRNQFIQYLEFVALKVVLMIF